MIQLLAAFLERYGDRVADEHREVCVRFVASLDGVPIEGVARIREVPQFGAGRTPSSKSHFGTAVPIPPLRVPVPA